MRSLKKPEMFIPSIEALFSNISYSSLLSLTMTGTDFFSSSDFFFADIFIVYIVHTVKIICQVKNNI